MLKLLRLILGKLILFIDRLTTPKSIVRTSVSQALINAQTASFVLYELEACPFCVKTRRSVKRLGLHIERRDVGKNPAFKQELISGGGQFQVPCLKITDSGGSVQWMYESSAIIAHLENRFGHS